LDGGDDSGNNSWRTFNELKMACPEDLFDYMLNPSPGMIRPKTKTKKGKKKKQEEAAHIKMLRTLQEPCPQEKMDEVKGYVDHMRIGELPHSSSEDEDPFDIPGSPDLS